jgi:ferredoxin, 2Fe-2S
MPRLIVMPHPELCPQGAEFDVLPDEMLCDALLDRGLSIEHACEKSGACATCHVVVRAGLESLEPPDDVEDDLLDQAWGLTPQSRLSCQVTIKNGDLVIEIPRYMVNLNRKSEAE